MHRKASYLIAEDGVIFFNAANLRADEILRHIMECMLRTYVFFL